MVLKSLNLPCSPSGPTPLTQGPQSSHQGKPTHRELYGQGLGFCWNLPSTSCKTAAWNLYRGAWVTDDETDKWCHSRMCVSGVFPFFLTIFLLFFIFLFFLSNKRCLCILFLFRLNVVICLFVFLELQNRSKIVCFFGGKKMKSAWKIYRKIKTDFGAKKCKK